MRGNAKAQFGFSSCEGTWNVMKSMQKRDWHGDRTQSSSARRLGGEMAGVAGLEPVTSAVTGQRSNQLSYTPAKGHAK